MEKRKIKVLVPIDDTQTSKSVIDYIINMSSTSRSWHICLVHIHRIPLASEELMGKKFTSVQPKKMLAMLENAKNTLVEQGFIPEMVDMEVIKQDYPSVAEGIIDQYKRQECDLVIIGRRKMSKAEEFVMGDISIKLIRMLERAAVLVVTR